MLAHESERNPRPTRPCRDRLDDQRLKKKCRTDVQYNVHNVQAGFVRVYNADFSSPAVTSGVPGLVVLALAVVLAAPPCCDDGPGTSPCSPSSVKDVK